MTKNQSNKHTESSMKAKLADIAHFQSGIYDKPGIDPDLLYLQAIHFPNSLEFDRSVKPALKQNYSHQKHLLAEGDILFAAKGLNNFAVVYHSSIGPAVASSSFIVLRLSQKYSKAIYPDYLSWALSHDKQVKLLHSKQLGTTIPSINISQLKELIIDLPLLDVQHKIVAVHKLRAKERQLVSRLEKCRDIQVQLLLSNAPKNNHGQ